MPKTEKEPASIVVRRAEITDLINIFKIVQVKYPDSTKDAFGSAAYLMGVIRQGYVIVASLSGRIVGCIAAELSEGPASISTYVVARGFEDVGVLEALLAALIRANKEIGVRVLVPVDEQKTMDILEDSDFVPVKTLFELPGVIPEPE